MTQGQGAHQDQLTTHYTSDVIRIEPSPKWVRAVLAGRVTVDSRRAVLLLERGHVPVYYFPMEDVRMDFMSTTDHRTLCPYKGEASYWSLTLGDSTVENAAWGYPTPSASAPEPEEAPDLRGYVAFYWNKVEAWFEEDEEVFVHPRDPYKRVDVVQSSRHVRVVVGDETVAETDKPVLLFETGLPTRYYIPKVDVRMDLLVPSEKLTRCPYKGEAGYYSVAAGGRVAEEIAWYYRYPTMESAKIAGRICFFNERVDAL